MEGVQKEFSRILISFSDLAFLQMSLDKGFYSSSPFLIKPWFFLHSSPARVYLSGHPHLTLFLRRVTNNSIYYLLFTILESRSQASVKSLTKPTLDCVNLFLYDLFHLRFFLVSYNFGQVLYMCNPLSFLKHCPLFTYPRMWFVFLPAPE